jgi:HEAT repeat protein
VEPVAAIMNKDENSYVRATAALVLGDLKDTRGVEPLIEALSDESHGVRKNAAFALKRITGQNFGIDPSKWQEWWEKNRAK